MIEKIECDNITSGVGVLSPTTYGVMTQGRLTPSRHPRFKRSASEVEKCQHVPCPACVMCSTEVSNTFEYQNICVYRWLNTVHGSNWVQRRFSSCRIFQALSVHRFCVLFFIEQRLFDGTTCCFSPPGRCTSLALRRARELQVLHRDCQADYDR